VPFKNNLILAGIVTAIFLAVSCDALAQIPVETAAGSETIEVTDSTGTKFEFGKAPLKVISTSPAITEIICFVGALDTLMGVTTLCDYPEDVKKIEKIGDINLNYEKILQIKPDVVFIMSGLRAKEKEVLESFGIKAFTLELNSFETVFGAIDTLSKIFNKKVNSSSLSRHLCMIKTEIKKKQKQPIRTVYFETWGEPPMTVGNKSFLNDIMKSAFAINVFSDVDSDNFPVSLEKVMEKNPQYIIMAYPGKTSEISIRSGFSGLIAVKDGNIITVDYNIYVRPGPRMVKGVLDLYNKLYSDKPIDPDKIFSK